MNSEKNRMERNRNNSGEDVLGEELGSALRDFRRSVHAWSDAAYQRPRLAASPASSMKWRAAVSWALGCVLVLGVATGGVYHRQHELEIARQAEVQRQAEAARAAAARTAAEDEDSLLAHVDSDVSRQLPAAMDALEDDSKQ